MEARKVEKQLLREAERELVAREGRECSWEELLEYFELFNRSEAEKGRAFTTKETLQDYLRAIRKWTFLWMKRPVSTITEFDIRDVIDQMAEAGRSNAQQVKLKQIISKIFNFGLSRRKIQSTKVTPLFQAISIQQNTVHRPVKYCTNRLLEIHYPLKDRFQD
jgi:hypothetical protein